MSGTAQKTAVAALIAVLACIKAFVPVPSYMGEGMAASAFTHHFFHANWFHLAVNCYAAAVLFGRRLSWGELLCAYIIASISYFAAFHPAVGFSNILYAVMGLRTPSLQSSWWRSTNTKIFLAVTFGYLFVPGVSASTHIASFLLGVTVAVARRIRREMNTDYGKAKRR